MGNADVNDDGQTTLEELVTGADLLRDHEHRARVRPEPGSLTAPRPGGGASACVHQGREGQILERLMFSEHFESILAKRFGAMKRFGLEGAESIPGLKFLVDKVTELGVEEVVLGMPHRGRLNTLANVVRKPIEIIFKEFKGKHAMDIEVEDVDDDWGSSGDVKYHMGTTYTPSTLTVGGSRWSSCRTRATSKR